MAGILVIAPDSFKGTFSAHEVAVALAEGASSAGATCVVLPLADGGEGTSEILGLAAEGSTSTAHASDPLGGPIRADFHLSADWSTAFIDVASASGLSLVAEEERDPMAATTFGTGQLMVAARDLGVTRIVVGAGGSATTDGGAGALQALAEAGGLGAIEVTVLCDVTTPFEKAAEVFAPQKGADEQQVQELTVRLVDLAAQWPRDPRGIPRTGAAGGLAGGLWANLGAELVSGIDYVLDAVGFDDALAGADAVVTGEGRLDVQTREGKVIDGVLRRCRARGIPVHAVVGQCALADPAVADLGLADVRIAGTQPALVAAGRDVAALLVN